MSLFDVIKYPISIPPTEEQILSLPEDIIRKFKLMNRFDPIHTPESIHYWFIEHGREYEPGSPSLKYIESLKKIIQEY
jgi:hypothetical protein